MSFSFLLLRLCVPHGHVMLQPVLPVGTLCDATLKRARVALCSVAVFLSKGLFNTFLSYRDLNIGHCCFSDLVASKFDSIKWSCRMIFALCFLLSSQSRWKLWAGQGEECSKRAMRVVWKLLCCCFMALSIFSSILFLHCPLHRVQMCTAPACGSITWAAVIPKRYSTWLPWLYAACHSWITLLCSRAQVWFPATVAAFRRNMCVLKFSCTLENHRLSKVIRSPLLWRAS